MVRVQQTILHECWKPSFARYLNPKYTRLRRDLERYLDAYDTDRTHTGRRTKGLTPGDWDSVTDIDSLTAGIEAAMKEAGRDRS